MRSPQELLAVPYAMLRFPLAMVDQSVRRGLPPRSRARTVLDHGLGLFDHWAGLILDDREIAQSGRTRIACAGVFRPDAVPLPSAWPGHTLYALTRVADGRT